AGECLLCNGGENWEREKGKGQECRVQVRPGIWLWNQENIPLTRENFHKKEGDFKKLGKNKGAGWDCCCLYPAQLKSWLACSSPWFCAAGLGLYRVEELKLYQFLITIRMKLAQDKKTAPCAICGDQVI
ncbi:unnamed protein product, partial [Urochloa humidicola]